MKSTRYPCSGDSRKQVTHSGFIVLAQACASTSTIDHQNRRQCGAGTVHPSAISFAALLADIYIDISTVCPPRGHHDASECLLMRMARSIDMAKTLQSSVAADRNREKAEHCRRGKQRGGRQPGEPQDFNDLNGQCDAAKRIFAFALHSEASIYVAASSDLSHQGAAGLNDQRKTLWRRVP
ncbi:hypothetical protein EV128_10974 [Rhizobium azibense]|nr:hypothetical protein EV128_10974 [Rhizobium azibense]